jgi:hypothetical protein
VVGGTYSRLLLPLNCICATFAAKGAAVDGANPDVLSGIIGSAIGLVFAEECLLAWSMYGGKYSRSLGGGSWLRRCRSAGETLRLCGAESLGLRCFTGLLAVLLTVTASVEDEEVEETLRRLG